MRQPSPHQVFLRSRRSVRRFLPQPVAEELLEQILETATWAPSAHNRQPWRFAVLKSAAAREKLAAEMGAEFRQDLLSDGAAPPEAENTVRRSQERIIQAPAAILLCLDMSVMDTYPDIVRQQAEYQMAVQSTAMAGAVLLLAAHAEGLGGVWVCSPLFAPNAARRSLSLPESWSPQGLVLLGYPAKTPPGRQREPVSNVARFL